MLRNLSLSEDGLFDTIYDFVINLLNTANILDLCRKLSGLSKVLLFIDFFYSCYGQTRLIFLFLCTFLQLRLGGWMVKDLGFVALCWRLILASFNFHFDLRDLKIGHCNTRVFRRQKDSRTRPWVIFSSFRCICIVCIPSTGLLIENRSPLNLLFKLGYSRLLIAFEMQLVIDYFVIVFLIFIGYNATYIQLVNPLFPLCIENPI